VATAPTFHEDQRLEWDWQETLTGHKVVLFDLIEPVQAPEAPETIGSNRDAAAKAVPKRAREISPEQSPTRAPEQAPEGPVGLGDEVPRDTIVVDSRPTKDAEAGDQGPRVRGPLDPEIREL
jgi:hypothetical protein